MDKVLYDQSPDGVWRFEEGQLRSAELSVEPFTIDFFERFTFARFLPGSQPTIALAFESSQPWSMDGSYGDRYGGIEILALTELPGRWSLVAFEFDHRRFDETFEPVDVIWHPRGLLAWLHEGELHFQLLAHPRGPITEDLLPSRDSEHEMAWSHYLSGTRASLSIDEPGRLLTSEDEDGFDVIDLDRRCWSRDGGDWEGPGTEP